jgi:hypothetical protein
MWRDVMPLVRFEFILKGLYLGTLLLLALQQPGWSRAGVVGVGLFGGLVIGIALAMLVQFKRLGQSFRSPVAFLIFALLESPLLVSASIVGGFLGGLYFEFPTILDQHMTLYCLGGGVIFGLSLAELRRLPTQRSRLLVCLGLLCAIGVGLWYALEEGELLSSENRDEFGLLLLAGLPIFYLLTFIAIAEESEAEIAAICAILGVGIHLSGFADQLRPAPAFLLPIMLYFVYATKFLNGLRIFKHVLRGNRFLRSGSIRDSLLSFRRAMELDPNSPMANAGLWKLHSTLDIDQVSKDPVVCELLDFNLCLNRAGQLLLNGKPSEAAQEQAGKLLDLVEERYPLLRSHVGYFRAVSQLHRGDVGGAGSTVAEVLDPENWPLDDPQRDKILFASWQLALLLHPGLRERVGEVQLKLPNRIMEAIRATERQLVKEPENTNAKLLREQLYPQLTEVEFIAGYPRAKPGEFDFALIESFGLAMLNDPNQWIRGAEFLRMVAAGQSMRAPVIFKQLSDVASKYEATAESHEYLLRAKKVGLSLGADKLEEESKKAFYASVKQLADAAAARGEWDQAIEEYSLYSQSDTSGKETLRQLSEMYAKKADALNALRIVEKATKLFGTDKDLEKRKDQYYWSVDLATFPEKAEEARSYFDVNYCITKAKELLDSRSEELDVLDWAEHLTKLSLILQPKHLIGKVQAARCALRRSMADEALQHLEDVRELTPSGTEEKEAWYFAIKQLGRMYLETFSRPDLALTCFQTYGESLKSGADTYFDIARCYEAMGDTSKAISQFKKVLSYEKHPLRWDAEEAVRRLGGTL